MEQGHQERFVKHEYEVADHLDHLLCNDNLLYELRGNQMIPMFQAACESRANEDGCTSKS